MDADQEMRYKIALSHQILFMEGIAPHDILGCISGKEPGGSKVWVKPSGLGFDEVTSDSLVSMDLADNKTSCESGELFPEMALHHSIYCARPEISCIVHVHSFFGTLLSDIWEGRILRVNQQTQQFASGIGFYDSSTTVTTSEQGQKAALALGGSYALLLKSHGVVTVAVSVEQATVLAVQLERAAQSHLIMSKHEDVKEIPMDAALHWAEELFHMQHCRARFEYWARKLKRTRRGS